MSTTTKLPPAAMEHARRILAEHVADDDTRCRGCLAGGRLVANAHCVHKAWAVGALAQRGHWPDVA